MLQNYMIRYTETPSGYMGQLVEWPEVTTEGRTITECREYLVDALREMIAAYRQLGKEIPKVPGVKSMFPKIERVRYPGG